MAKKSKLEELSHFNGRPMYYDKDGSPMALLDWAKKFEDREYQRVARDLVMVGPQTYLVSTVWLGMDHGAMFGASLPHIFETMVFEGNDPDSPSRPLDELTERYSTLEDALAGHKAVCGEVPNFVREHGE